MCLSDTLFCCVKYPLRISSDVLAQVAFAAATIFKAISLTSHLIQRQRLFDFSRVFCFSSKLLVNLIHCRGVPDRETNSVRFSSISVGTQTNIHVNSAFCYHFWTLEQYSGVNRLLKAIMCGWTIFLVNLLFLPGSRYVCGPLYRRAQHCRSNATTSCDWQTCV